MAKIKQSPILIRHTKAMKSYMALRGRLVKLGFKKHEVINFFEARMLEIEKEE